MREIIRVTLDYDFISMWPYMSGQTVSVYIDDEKINFFALPSKYKHYNPAYQSLRDHEAMLPADKGLLTVQKNGIYTITHHDTESVNSWHAHQSLMKLLYMAVAEWMCKPENETIKQGYMVKYVL